jgi:hypothetical protein
MKEGNNSDRAKLGSWQAGDVIKQAEKWADKSFALIETRDGRYL